MSTLAGVISSIGGGAGSGPGAHRYWRILFTDSGSFNGAALAEVEFYKTVGGANQASGGTAISGEDAFGGTAAQAFDGDKTTSFWACNGIDGDSWIGYDFGSGNDIEILQFEITSRDGSDGNQVGDEFQIEYSDDNSSWTTVTTYVDNNSWSASESRKYSV